MNLIIKQASAFTVEELTGLGLTGIPTDWVLESFPYTGLVPDGYTQATDTDVATIKANNQAAYDAWLATIKVQTVQAGPSPRSSTGIPLVDTSNMQGLVGANSITVSTHDFSDRTSWYQRSVKVTSETLIDSGNGLLFNSAHPFWVNMDSLRLTYDYKLIPERDGSYTERGDRRPIISVGGSPLNDPTSDVTPGYTINYAAGTVTFDESQTGNTITATYWHTDGVARCSEWILNPPAGTAYLLGYIEFQFSKSINFTTAMNVEIWAGGAVSDYSDFNVDLYNVGYGQNRSRYRGPVDFLNICTNRASQIIPAFGGLTDDTLIFPFDYLIQSVLRSSQGVVIMFHLENEIAYTNAELATGTFYMQIVPESSL